MDLWIWIVIAVVVVVVAIAAVVWERRRQGRRLRRRFGPEYEREVARHDDRSAAHDELERRIAHRDEFELRELDEAEREDYTRRWLAVQRTFTHDPGRALREADEVLTALFVDIGYPSQRFDDRAADLSVDHGDVTRDYREARAVVEDVHRGTAGTEEVRRALLQYRTVFQRVAGVDVHEGVESAPTASQDTRPGLLPADDRATLGTRMQKVEEAFVDDAGAAVRQADEVVEDLVSQLRAALDRRLAGHRERWDHNEATTEQLRTVLGDYRELFDALVATPDPAPEEGSDQRERSTRREGRDSEGSEG